MKKRIGIAAALFILYLASAFSQEREVFAPFVSRLSAQEDNDGIKLTWKDTNDVAGKIFVYRHTEEISDGNFIRAVKIAELETGAESYFDKPADLQKYYYAVLIQGEGEKLFNIFIPFRNKTTMPVGLSQIVTEEDLAARIAGIKASIQNDFVILSYESSAKDREITVYRSTAPIRTQADLLQSAALRTVLSSRTTVQDYPVPGVNYYYAVIDTALVKLGKITLKSGENTTTLPVQIPLGTRIGLPEATASRPFPLPLFPLTLNVETGVSLGTPYLTMPTERRLDAKTRETLFKIYRSTPDFSPPEPEFYIFPEDSMGNGASASFGEAFTLQTILNEAVKTSDWAKVERDLNNFLGLHRTRDLELRAHFYLGQIYYKQRNYQKAFRQFLITENAHYVETAKWMDAIFRKLRTS